MTNCKLVRRIALNAKLACWSLVIALGYVCSREVRQLWAKNRKSPTCVFEPVEALLNELGSL